MATEESKPDALQTTENRLKALTDKILQGALDNVSIKSPARAEKIRAEIAAGGVRFVVDRVNHKPMTVTIAAIDGDGNLVIDGDGNPEIFSTFGGDAPERFFSAPAGPTN